jgi:WD40 repeat protein
MINIPAHLDAITSLRWNNNDSQILTSSKDKTVKLWDIKTGKRVLQFRLNAMVSSVTFCKNYRYIATALVDKNLYINDITTKQLVSTINLEYIADDILYSDDRDLLIISCFASKSIVLFDIMNKVEVYKFTTNDNILSMSLNRTGKYLLVNTSTISPMIAMFNLQTKTNERNFFGHRQENSGRYVAFGGKDENFIVCGSDSKEILIWNRRFSLPIVTIPNAHANIINSVIWPQTLNSMIISCGEDNSIKFFANEEINKIQEDKGYKNKETIDLIDISLTNGNNNFINENDGDSNSNLSQEEDNEDESDFNC